MCTLLEELIFERQCNDHLCWAAVASGISAFYKDDPPLKQCKIAHDQLLTTQRTAPDCCPKFKGDKCNKDCDQDADLEDVLTRIKHLEGLLEGPPSDDDLKTVMAKIQARFPVCVRVEFAGGGGHFVVIQGFCDEDPHNIKVVICDPGGLGTTTTLPLGDFKTAYLNTGTWSRTFFTKQKE